MDHQLATPKELLTSSTSYLLHLRDTLALVPDATYTRISTALPGSTIGKHVRHVLDHFMLLLASSGRVNYSLRERNEDTQSSVASGQAAILRTVERIRSVLEDGCSVNVESPVCIEDTLPGGNDRAFVSTLGRELWFCTHHMIHHNAVIACLMFEFGLQPPKEFAYAPSTIKRSQ
ncbi:hypothetical protein GGI25_005867 [Coemansia spiralis]|uniref:DinB-like domain-containing protein n=2 Tax=Coemansia TaxID=4863 RepID=A0A9W8G1G9_9FUNG|nr:hypothetical protein BX070DRAFT_254760 [Coemansia spiralis]KAJ1989420.1 hypothetical protein EDC05_004678 [Coemansia umbellata]KAJ2620370.1 hypothetical protein GGI26_005079 [Coemansia sp. RSA 1358]KAJ2670369.1 hypothetical protein GGI25_005867 [Coemansia spiralis]